MIPEKWQEKKLGDLLVLEYGIGLPESLRSGAGFPVYGSNGIVGYHRAYIVPGPGIVVGRKGTVGSVAWSESPFWPIDTSYYVFLKDGFDIRWCYWLLQSLELNRNDSSTGVPGLNRNDAYRINAKIPPLPEQRRIAEILDTIDEAIQKTETLISKLKAMKQGLLHDLLTRGLDKNGKLRNPKTHPEQFKDSPLGRIPREWEVRPLGRTATLQRGFDLPIQNRRSGDVPIFGSNGIDGWHNSPGVIGPGVITGRSGSIGFVYYIDTCFWPLNTTLYVKEFHGNLPEFVSLLLQSLRLDRFTAATGIPSLNRNFVHPIEVVVPGPPEQSRIVDMVTAHDARIRAEELYRDKLKLQKKGLMHDLLTGKVRVK